MRYAEAVGIGGKSRAKGRLGEILLKSGLITREGLGRALEEQRQSKDRLGSILLRTEAIDEAVLARCLAIQWGYPYIELAGARIDPNAVAAVSESIAREHDAMPVELRHRLLTVALANPLDYEGVQNLGFATGLQIRPAVATPGDIREAIDRHYTDRVSVENLVQRSFPKIREEDLRPVLSALSAVADERKPIEERGRMAPVVRLVDLIIGRAIKLRASDIHIEPGRLDLCVRYRIDGLLKEDIRISIAALAALVSRIKILARLDIAERRLPQDGAIRFPLDRKEIDLRVSTLPTYYGEKVVIRVLDRERTIVSVDELGFSKPNRRTLEMFLQKKQGILLLTGPTGSGKTTTLYAFIRALASETRNIVTVEDPIEYHLDGISQVQVKPGIGLTFASCLRSILRQDPNIILVGEIRDLETAEIAVRAAMTGHLVLSTLHTNDAPSAVTRLADLGIPRYLLASTLIGVIAQRLVRQICDRCKGSFTEKDGKNSGIGLYRKGNGCPACHFLGVRGRVGIFEILDVAPVLADRIASGDSQQALRETARDGGMRSLLEDGIDKIREGLIGPEELFRVVDPPSEDPAKAGEGSAGFDREVVDQAGWAEPDGDENHHGEAEPF